MRVGINETMNCVFANLSSSSELVGNKFIETTLKNKVIRIVFKVEIEHQIHEIDIMAR